MINPIKLLQVPWILMWTISFLIFALFKFLTWRQAIQRGLPALSLRSVAYLFAWPGMDAKRFLDQRVSVAPPRLWSWCFAWAKTLFGVILLWEVARYAGHGWIAGWIGMVGLIFILHFGTFHLLALFWQRAGILADPLMRWPILAESLSDFWGNRWNTAFRDLAFGLLFVSLAQRIKPRLALLLTFLFSGLIHDVVISCPPELVTVGQRSIFCSKAAVCFSSAQNPRVAGLPAIPALGEFSP